MSIGQSSGKFLGTDEASIAGGPDYADHGTEFTSQDLKVQDSEIIFVQCKVKGGHGSNSGNCIFKFVASADGVNFTTEYFLQLRVPMSGTNAVVKGWHVNVTGIHTIRLQQIENAETESTYTALLTNARWGKSFF